MQSRIFLQLEEGKESYQRTASKSIHLRALKFLLLFVAAGVVFSALSFCMIWFFDLHTVALQAGSGVECASTAEEQTHLGQWIAPPSTLMHSMSDEELFWRASFAPQVKKYPYRRVPKIAFMFLSRGPLPLAPLWEMFFRGHEGRYSIYIHTLPDFRPNFQSTSVFYGRVIPSQKAEWGKMSVCDAERRLLANALLDLDNERFILLSESCIPLYNFSIIYQYLIRSRYSFVGAFDDPGPYGRGRYNKNMAPEVNITKWRKGAQWFEVNRELAISLIKDTKYHDKFSEFCTGSCYSDEHYFPTMLTVESPHRIANRSITWVDWSRGGAHPATFGKGDITKVFLKRILEGKRCLYNDQPSDVCFLFARKFTRNTLDPLLQYAPTLLGLS